MYNSTAWGNMPEKIEYPTTQNEYTHLTVNPGTTETVLLRDVQDYHEGTDPLGNKIARFRFNGKNLLRAHLPLEANPREPGTSTAVSRMRLTLKEEASSFHLKNNGLTIFSSTVSHDNQKKEVTISFDKENQGICNGGHTYFAVSTALSRSEIQPSTEFYINCEVIVHPSTLPPDEYKKATVAISRARNTNSQLKPFSMADQLGFFAPMKAFMPGASDRVSWHENDSSALDGAISVTELLRYLACLSPDLFHHSALPSPNSNHKSASTGSKAKIWDPWFTDCENDKTPQLASMYPLIMDVIMIKEYIAEKILSEVFASGFKRMNLWQNYMSAGEDKRLSLVDNKTEVAKIGVTVEIMMLGLLRDNVVRINNSKGRTTYIGWYTNPTTLIDKKLDGTMGSLGTVFQNANNDSKAFIRDDSAYAHQMVRWDPSLNFNPPDNPFMLFDVVTGEQYTSDGGKFDHKMDPTTGRMIPCNDGTETHRKL